MPTRIIRDGILTSERVNRLSERAELFYRRLMSVVDDHGRFYSNPTLLRASCYPLKVDSIKDSDIHKHLLEAKEAGLIQLYESKGTKYLQIIDFGQRVQSKSKFPEPSTVVHGDSPCATVENRLVGVGVGVVDEVEGDIGAEPAEPPPPPAITLPLVDKTEFPITQAQVAEFKSLYPAVDVMAQLREMRGWCIGNPTKRKTKAGILRFVTTWLAREQDKGPRQSPQEATTGGGSRGSSAPRPNTPENRLEDAKLFAARMVDLGQWSKEQAKAHIEGARK